MSPLKLADSAETPAAGVGSADRGLDPNRARDGRNPMSNPTYPSDAARPPRVDRVVALAAAVAGAAAIVASYRSLASLAEYAGWDGWLIWLLPASIDAYAIAATRVWLSRSVSASARRIARTNAVAAIGASVAGNAVSHAITAGVLPLTWHVVVIVASVPPVVVGLVLHLWQLNATGTEDTEPEPATETEQVSEAPEPAPAPEPETAPVMTAPATADLSGMSKADAIREALRVLDTADVPAAVAWLADRGVSVDRSYAYEVANGRAGTRQRRGGQPTEPTSEPTEPATETSGPDEPTTAPRVAVVAALPAPTEAA